jgi:hypothetical protein
MGSYHGEKPDGKIKMQFIVTHRVMLFEANMKKTIMLS